MHVNPHHVKKSKELDDNNPNKNDRKDPKTIAALVNEGRFSYPYIPTGIYAEIRSLSNLRFQTQEELTRIKNRIARWFAIYFPEYKDVYGDYKAVSGRMVFTSHINTDNQSFFCYRCNFSVLCVTIHFRYLSGGEAGIFT